MSGIIRSIVYIRRLRKICYNKMIQKTLEVLKQFQAHQGAKLQIHSSNLIEKRPQNPEVTTRSYNSGVQVGLKDVYVNKINEIDQKLGENEIAADLDTYREPGGKFQDYGEIDNVFDQGKTHLVHKQGEVLLVDVWATWCGPCQNPMKHNQEMLEKNEAVWGDKVKIVGVSVDEDKKVIQQRVTSRKWQKITHLTLLGWKHDHAIIKDFKINGIPFICLVNKWGKINFTGHPSEINLETRINELLSEQQDSSQKPRAAPASVTQNNSNKESIDKIFSLLTKENIQKEFKDVGLICFRSNKKQKYENGVSSSELSINAYYLDGDHVAENLVKNLFDNHPGVTLKLNTVKYTPIPQIDHPQCSLCQAKDLQFPFYWLKWEEGDKFGCRTCVQKKSQVQGHHYAYEKNSVLLFGKWEKVATKDLGGNLQPADVTKVDQPHGFGCNGCSQGSEGVGYARYIALGVRCDPNFKSGGNLDLCQGCMSKLIEKDQGVIDSLLPEGHKDNHPFLRVLYNTNGYYEY